MGKKEKQIDTRSYHGSDGGTTPKNSNCYREAGKPYDLDEQMVEAKRDWQEACMHAEAAIHKTLETVSVYSSCRKSKDTANLQTSVNLSVLMIVEPSKPCVSIVRLRSACTS